MLGSVADAEDVVQEAFLRWLRHRSRPDRASPRRSLRRVVTRLCLDQLKSARARRETYVGALAARAGGRGGGGRGRRHRCR